MLIEGPSVIIASSPPEEQDQQPLIISELVDEIDFSSIVAEVVNNGWISEVDNSIDIRSIKSIWFLIDYCTETF